MNLLRIRYFVEAARCGSFTEASKRLYTSQPNLSKQIAAFEGEIGTQLFIRANRSIKLTRAGQYVYDQLKDLPSHAEHVFRQARAMGRDYAEKLSIGILDGQDFNKALKERFRAVAESCPGLEYELDRNGFRNLKDGLESARYDMVITLSFDLQDRPDILFRSLIRQNGAIAVSRARPIAAREHAELYDFRDEDFVSISPEESNGGYRLLIDQCASHGFHPRIVRLAYSMESLLLCVETGIGIAILDRNTRFESSADVRLFPLPDSANADVVVAWMKDNDNPDIQRILEAIGQGDARPPVAPQPGGSPRP